MNLRDPWLNDQPSVMGASANLLFLRGVSLPLLPCSHYFSVHRTSVDVISQSSAVRSITMYVHSREEASMNPSPEYLAENNASTIVSVVGVFGFLALVAVLLRLYVRGAMLKFLGADDLAIALSMVNKSQPIDGLGRHYQIIAQHIVTYLHWEFAHALLSLFGIAMVKISVSLLLLRLVPHKHYRWFLWGIISKAHRLTL
jgi:hypothetical protein